MNFVGWNGLQDWAVNATGQETLGVGIRPYGLHAGNLAALVAYPYLLCERFKALNVTNPQFTFQVWLNDIEPVVYVGADGKTESANAANMYPGSTTFQFTPAPAGHEGNLADYWQPVIQGVVEGTIGAAFPQVKLEFRRASELVTTPEFQRTVIGCLEQAYPIGRFIELLTRTRIKGDPEFVWPLCPDCHTPVSDAQIEYGMRHKPPRVIADGEHYINKDIGQLDWAVQFRMLQVARLAAVQPDLWVIGLDHLPANQTGILGALADYFHIQPYRGDFLYTPLLFADGDKKLSKSLGNAVYIAPSVLIDALRKNENHGLNMEFAPVSRDIIAVGEELLPDYMLDDKANRLRAVFRELTAYQKSDKGELFKRTNARRAISEWDVAEILGVPHL